MIVECPKCHKKYEVEDMYIPIGGAPIRCPNCKNIFGIYVEPIDIPMTEIVEEENTGFASQTPSQKETTVSTESEIKETFKDETLPKDFPDLGQLGSFSSESIDNPFATKPDLTQSQQTPDFGVPPTFAKPSVEEVKKPEPFASPFAQPQESFKPQQAPDFGVPPAFTKPSFEEVKKPEPFASPFAQPQESFKPQQAPDFGVPPAFAKPSVEEVKKPEPFASPFAQPQESFKPQQTPDFGVPPAFAKPSVEEKIATPTHAGKVGSPVFDVLLAGFNLPPDFKSLPDAVQKAHKDAIKLARQLAKDILLYHKDDVERGLASGNIKEVLKEEIEKSYKFYSQRISPEIINSTNYFKEALNKIIAKGEKIF